MPNYSESATVEMIRLALNAATARQAVHASNIANANVEGFTASRVSFEDQLGAVREQLTRGERVSVATLLPEPLVELDISRLHQKVELDTEVASMSQNALQYQALLKVLGRHLSLTAVAIGSGRN